MRKFWSDLSKSERNRPRFRSACCSQSLLQHYHKKILSEVLCILNRIAASAQTRNGPPIVRKLGERVARLLLLASVAAEKIRLQRVVTNSRGSPHPARQPSRHERTLWFSLLYTSINGGMRPRRSCLPLVECKVCSCDTWLILSRKKTE